MKEFSQEKVKKGYENYMYESMSGSTSSQESLRKTSKWQEDKTNKKDDMFQSKVEKEKVNVDASILKDFIVVPKSNEVDLIEK